MTWGICATVLAPTETILKFAAYHLEQGAHRLYLYLDNDNQDAYHVLKQHAKVRVRMCDVGYWAKVSGRRPLKHQVRQTVNATHAYNRPTEVDWLTHIDVDEFLVSNQPISDILRTVPASRNCLRVRPMELLGGSKTAFKTFIAAPNRSTLVRKIYPDFGQYLRGGFVSHVAGKVFVRKGLPDITVKIHNAFQDDVAFADTLELDAIQLAHCHAASWDAWRAAYDYRLDKGSYRADLKPAAEAGSSAVNKHALFQQLQAEEGEAGLRRFYDEVIGDSADLRARLSAHGLLREVDLNLEAALAKHFPNATV
ncbi:glycosyltransferase family 2 protein [uncultured Tateyamaria sp.]|uniref:glycosyltransferase family 2 protein n=1 Tax=uncultured Tateyamaria sp. TaxID=455651 RepID=UPI0026116D5D|nr:glycosyltransferase family 2 protein [uncultured Tateyamaria sp.]